MIQQVRRVEMLVRNMNRFAHSVDEPAKNVDIGNIVALVVALTSRSFLRGVMLSTFIIANTPSSHDGFGFL